MKLSEKLESKQPFVLLLIGPPLSGKTTFVSNNFDADSVTIISRDDLVIELSGISDYNLAFNTVDQKLVKAELTKRLIEAGKSNKNVIIDMTNMTSKRRRKSLSHFNDYYKIGVIFPILEKCEYNRRNLNRLLDENKLIKDSIINRMINQFQEIRENEGFDEIINF
jgi:predicted kinase